MVKLREGYSLDLKTCRTGVMMNRVRVKRKRMAVQQRMMTDWVSTEKEIQRRKTEKGKQNEKGLVRSQ
jgi:hypothetical protein